jgi:hypothetical protein
MSVAVVSAVWGDYLRFLPGWVEMVGLLSPQPDQVVIATVPKHAAEVRRMSGATVVVQDGNPPAGDFMVPWMINQAVKAVTADWLALLGMDDRFLPHAIASLNDVDADIVSISAMTTNGTFIQARTEQHLRVVADDMILGPSYIRTKLFREMGGYRTEWFLSDWMLWVDAYLAGGRIVTWNHPTHILDISSPGRFSSNRAPNDEYRHIRDRMRFGLAAGLR